MRNSRSRNGCYTAQKKLKMSAMLPSRRRYIRYTAQQKWKCPIYDTTELLMYLCYSAQLKWKFSLFCTTEEEMLVLQHNRIGNVRYTAQ
jgi:hypothetical protein